MHETVIAQQIIRDAEKQGRVKALKVEVGDLAHLPAEEVEEVLKDMTDWKISVVSRKARVKCSCGYKGEPKILERHHDLVLFACPECGAEPKVVEGRDIKIKEVTLE